MYTALILSFYNSKMYALFPPSLALHYLLFVFVVKQILPHLLNPDSEDRSAALHTCGEGEGRVAQKSILLQEL